MWISIVDVIWLNAQPSEAHVLNPAVVCAGAEAHSRTLPSSVQDLWSVRSTTNIVYFACPVFPGCLTYAARSNVTCVVF